MKFDIDITIFLVFLAVNLVVGLYYGRGVKTIKDYALGGRNFSTGTLVSTIVATWVGGGTFFITLSKTYSSGLYYLIASSAMFLQLIIIATFLVPRMGEFLGKTSVAEAMGDLYGIEVRTITAICGIILNIGGIAIQFKVFGTIFDYFLGIPSTYAIIIAALIVILYSAFGGIKAVTYTDIVQFITFTIAIPFIGAIIWNHLYDSGFNFSNSVQNPNFNLREVLNFGNPKFWQMIPLILYFAIPDMDSTDFQRISIGQSVKQVKKAYIISAILILLVRLAVAWIPFLIFHVNPNLEANKLLSYIVDNYTYVGLKALIIICIAAMAMSTADSRINSASVLFAHDINKVLKIKIKDIILSKIVAFGIGFFAIYLALSKNDLLNIIMTATSFYMPIVTVPLLLAIFGFRSTTKSVLTGMGAGFITVILWNLWDTQIDCIIPAMLVNAVFLIGSHYLLKQQGGWVKKAVTTPPVPSLPLLERLELFKQRKMAQLWTFIKGLGYIKFCQKNAPTNELTYMWLGIYFIFYTFTTMYSTHVELLKDSSKTILSCYQLMMVSGTTMAMYPIWPLSIPYAIKEAIIKFLWFIEVFYMLTFFSTFFVLLSNFGMMQLSLFSVNAVITVILTGLRTGITLVIAGFYLGICFFKYYTGIEVLDTSVGSPQFVFTYSLIFMGIALMIFIKPREEYQELLVAKNGHLEDQNNHLNDRIDFKTQEAQKALELKNEFLRNIQHESRTPITGIRSMGEALYEGYDKLTDQQKREGLKNIVKSSERLDSFVNNLVDLSKISNLTYQLNRTDVNLSELVYDRLNTCRKLYLNGKKYLEFSTHIENNIIFNCDEYYIKATLDNLIMNAIQYSKQQGKITVKLYKDNNSAVHFSIQDEGIGIPKEDLLDIFGAFVVSSKTRTPAGGRGVGLALCKKAIDLHGGTITANSDGESGSTFEFTLPTIV